MFSNCQHNVNYELPLSTSLLELDYNIPQNHTNGSVNFKSHDTRLSHLVVSLRLSIRSRITAKLIFSVSN